jgi:hypothetical protein
MVDAPADLALGDAAIAQRERHVLEHRHVGIERVVLEHHGDVAILGIEFVDDPAVDPDLARRDVFQAGDHAQQGALAAARGADEDDELAVGDFEVDAVHDRDLAKRLADPVETDPGHASPSAATPGANHSTHPPDRRPPRNRSLASITVLAPYSAHMIALT